MNDVCAAFKHKEWYHIFYQFGPFHDHNTKLIGWGHARSRDLVYWEILPEAIWPVPNKGEICYASGSAMVTDAGIPVLFFAWTPDGVWEGKGKREQRAALPVDEELREWRTVEIGLKAGSNGVPEDIKGSWADMFVFRSGSRIFATFKSAGGLLCEARNSELTDWHVTGRIEGIDGECPNFFPLDGKYVLLQSTYPISYQIGGFDADLFRFIPDGPRRTMDYGYGPKQPDNFSRGIYGTTVTTDETGRTLLLGWVSGFRPGRGWNGCMSLPRKLTIDIDGYLIQEPAAELTKLRREHSQSDEIIVMNDFHAVDGVTGDTLEIRIAIRPGSANACGLRLSRGNEITPDVEITVREDELDVAGTAVPGVLDAVTGQVTLHVFFDRSVLEVFINGGRQTVTKVVQAEPTEARLFVFAEGGSSVFSQIDVWELASIWPKRF